MPDQFPMPTGSWRFIEGDEACRLLARGVDLSEPDDQTLGMVPPSQATLNALRNDMTVLSQDHAIPVTPMDAVHACAVLQHNDAQGMILAFVFEQGAPEAAGMDGLPLKTPCLQARVSFQGEPFTTPVLGLRSPLMHQIFDVQLHFDALVAQGLREWEAHMLGRSIADQDHQDSHPTMGRRRL